MDGKEKKVTFTLEEFDEAVKLAMCEWETAGEKVVQGNDEFKNEKMTMGRLLMGLQNTAFGALIRQQLMKMVKED